MNQINQVSDMDIGDYSLDSINEFLKMETTLPNSHPLFNQKAIIKPLDQREIEEEDEDSLEEKYNNRLEFQRKKRRGIKNSK